MLQINIATLSRSELKGLLATATSRGQAALAEQIQAALDTQAADAAVRLASSHVAADEEPARIVFEDDEAAESSLRLGSLREPRSRRWPLALAAATIVGVGAAMAWAPLRAPAPARASSPRLAALTAPPTVPRAMAMVAEPAARPDPSPPAPAAAAPPAAAPPKPAPSTATAAAAATPQPPRRVDPCADPPTPADGTLCKDLALNLLDRELRDAYGRAIDAGADPRAIRQSQAAWRRARDPVSDPRALAELYERRIRDLKAATETAALREPGQAEGRRE
jgi:uncharacterized protein YecT (DUF1311 family)